jgi:hypothetical protein
LLYRFYTVLQVPHLYINPLTMASALEMDATMIRTHPYMWRASIWKVRQRLLQSRTPPINANN